MDMDEDTWESLKHDSTSPIPRANKLDEGLLIKGIGKVGKVDISEKEWESMVGKNFRDIAFKKGEGKATTKQAVEMINAIRRDNKEFSWILRKTPLRLTGGVL